MFGREEGELGPIYRAIERSIWALAPFLLVLLLVLNYRSLQDADDQAAVGWANDVAAENLDYCSKWGMPPGSGKHQSCIRDLVGIRARAEQRLRDQAVLSSVRF
jgi:hypothetical protein